MTHRIRNTYELLCGNFNFGAGECHHFFFIHRTLFHTTSPTLSGTNMLELISAKMKNLTVNQSRDPTPFSFLTAANRRYVVNIHGHIKSNYRIERENDFYLYAIKI